MNRVVPLRKSDPAPLHVYASVDAGRDNANAALAKAAQLKTIFSGSYTTPQMAARADDLAVGMIADLQAMRRALR